MLIETYMAAVWGRLGAVCCSLPDIAIPSKDVWRYFRKRLLQWQELDSTSYCCTLTTGGFFQFTCRSPTIDVYVHTSARTGRSKSGVELCFWSTFSCCPQSSVMTCAKWMHSPPVLNVMKQWLGSGMFLSVLPTLSQTALTSRLFWILNFGGGSLRYSQIIINYF